MRNVLRNLKKIERKLEKFGTTGTTHFRLRTYCIIILIYYVAVDIYGGIINYLYVPLTQSIRQISLISANIAVILTSLQFCSILMVITSLSANIRRALMEDFIHNDISSKELKEIINIYASLTDTASEFNKWISVKILLVFASQFLQVALPASSLIFNVVANKSVTAPALLLYKVGKNVIKLGVVIAIGQGYQKEVITYYFQLYIFKIIILFQNVLLRKALFKIITEKSKMKLNKEVTNEV
ncbi:7tm Chemosensory receptor [Popillia japonica]|uniref:7tm Chemosensory receptor n=1 Tax=Popillia japonica TaxID=7064 RepID=A0AAW1NDT8_POPJA